MRIKCSFTLDPNVHDHHSYAVNRLKSWQQDEFDRDDSKEVRLQRSCVFHRDLYLAGLYLYELAPKLPNLLSRALNDAEISIATLQQVLLSAGLELPIENQGLSASQWQQWTKMLDSSVKETEKSDIEAKAAQVSSDNQQLAALQSQLQQLLDHQALQVDFNSKFNLLVQNQQQLLSDIDTIKELESASPNYTIENTVLRLKLGQEDLMAELRSLRTQLSQNQAVAAPTSSKEESAGLDAQLEKARKVKAKGIW